jgi:hypothetical protein
LGNAFRIRDNIKLRSVVDMLLNHSSVKQMQQHPIVVQWLGDIGDVSDTKMNFADPVDNNKSQTGSPTSPTEEEEEQIRATVIVPCYSSYYCDYNADSKDDYEAHVVMRHGHSSAYPNKAEIEKLGLKTQGKSWEA